MTDEMDLAVNAACGEAERAQAKYGDFMSMHEAYGVLAEEVAELFDAVRMSQHHPSRASRIEAEAEQVAAVALRIRAQAYRVKR